MKRFSLVLMSLIACSCASSPDNFVSKYQKCNEQKFTDCMGVDSFRCDAEYSKAETLCQEKMEASPLVANMNEGMKKGYLAGCMLGGVSLSLGKNVKSTMQCAQ